MEHEQPSAQADQNTNPQQEGQGIQARINELTAKYRQQEENSQKLQQQLLESAAREAEMARKYAEMAQKPAQAPAPVDPLAHLKDKLDPIALEAFDAQRNAMQRQFEQQMAAMQRQLATQTAALQVQSLAAQVPGLPPAVAQEAVQLVQQWRAQGINFATEQDAIDIALGKYQRGQMARAAPVLHYAQNPAAPAVTPGFAPPPASRKKSLPDNFDSLSPADQLTIMEQNGIGDEPF